MAQDYAKAFYNSKAWKRCRDGFMKSKYFICERCGGAASICHHKKHITPENINNPEITLNWDNLEAICHVCHQGELRNGSATAPGISFDANGRVVYTPRIE